MKITKEQLKNIVRETLQEESEYQTFFKKALEKAGKSIPSMSDEEKKAFFNKIEKTWKGRGTKSEGNAFGAAVAKAKKDGDDEFEVGGKKYDLEEKYKGNMSDFKYDVVNALGNSGISPKAIKKISKKGKGFEVRMSSYMKDKSAWEKLGKEMGAELVDFQPGSINIGLYESINELSDKDIKKAEQIRKSMPGFVGEKFAKKASNEDILAFADLQDKEAQIYNSKIKPIRDAKKKLYKKYRIRESINEGPSTEEKRIAMLAVRKQAKYRNVSLEQAIQDQINALEELKRDAKRGKLK